MKRLRAPNPFPHWSDYDFGDANHLPIVPGLVGPCTAVRSTPDDTSRPVSSNPPAPGDAGTKEHTP
jgi:hypothetical protein